MTSQKIPGWVWLLAGLVLAGQAGVLGLRFNGVLQGPAKNLAPQALLGGAMVLAALVAWLLRFHSNQFPEVPARAGIIFLALFSLLLVVVYFRSMRGLLTMPYDLASWSEPMLVVDIIKLRTGAPLYLPPGDSNSNTYTFLAPAVTYALARLAGHPASIPAYRLIQQLFLALAAWFAALATLGLLRLANAEEALRRRHLWFPFFFFTAFLFATNDETGIFNIYLHNDPLALLVSTLAFWVLVKHVVTRSNRWFWLMAAMPAVGFLAKQYLALWAVVYVVCLWLDGEYPLRTVIKVAGACFGGVALAILACIAVWGQSFRYWVFQVMGGHVVYARFIGDRFGEAGWYIALGLAGGLVLVRGENFGRLLGIFAAALLLLLGGLYTSGITYHPSHLGPFTMVAACFFLAALAKLWPSGDTPSSGSRGQQWFQVVLGCAAVVAVFAALRFPEGRPNPVSPDLARYAHAIEQEFQGLPPGRVLLDSGDWIYLRENVVMTDRQAILVTHRDRRHLGGMIERARAKYYLRILIHILNDGRYSYDIGPGRGIERELQQGYREVRRIPHVQDVKSWIYGDLLMSDVAVLEPIPPGVASPVSEPAVHP